MSFEDAVAAALRKERPRRSPEPMFVIFRLPLPPSANHYFVERAVIRKDGKAIVMKHPGSDGIAYRRTVALELQGQKVPLRTLAGKLYVNISVYPPDRRRRDLDNLLKALLDALKTSELIEDDGDIDKLAIIRGEVMPGNAHIVVQIQEISPPGGLL